MTHHKGSAAVTALLVALGIIVLGGVGFVALHPGVFQAPVAETGGADDGIPAAPGGHPEEDPAAGEGMNAQASIVWRFTDAGDSQGAPHTAVAVAINGTTHDVGTFTGSCTELGATGGIDGTGLLAGELSATQCWFAGAGNEIGVFAYEGGGYDLMVGELSEGEEGSGLFRGNFITKAALPL